MKSLTLRIYLAVVAVLLLFALTAAWVAHRNIEDGRETHRRGMSHQRYEALSELIENSLPHQNASREDQAQTLLDLSERLHVPMALDDAQGQPIAQAPLFAMWARDNAKLFQSLAAPTPEDDDDERPAAIPVGALGEGLYRQVWSDGRVLWLIRPPRPPIDSALGAPRTFSPKPPIYWPRSIPWVPAADLLAALFLLFIAVAAGAWPVAHHLTRRLKLLQQGVERFGSGQLQQRVQVQGRDEVADLARSFNQTADQIEALVGAHRSLLANASHELRSPLARLKMAVSLMGDARPEQVLELQTEVHQNIGELDALVEEVLLASRLDANAPMQMQTVDVWHILQDEVKPFADFVQLAEVSPSFQDAWDLPADERLLRRAVRNLLENAKRYGAQDHHGQAMLKPVDVDVSWRDGGLDIAVQDRGMGVPVDQQERIFEPFYRMPGHAEHAGGVGLGLSLVRQIAQRHGGTVKCESREGGGSRFVISLPTHPRKSGVQT